MFQILLKLFKQAVPFRDTIIEATLLESEEYYQTFYSDGNQPLTAVISWTDPPGNVPAKMVDPTDLNLINDLDIQLINIHTGEITLPYILDPANPEFTATKGNNFRDNIEKIYLATPEPGFYQLKLSHKNNLEGSKQDFALILSGMSNPMDCTVQAGFTFPSASGCPGAIIEFSNTSTDGVTNQWYVNNNLVSSEDDFSYVFPDSGEYRVQLLVSNGDCVDVYEQTVTINEIPNPRFGYGGDALGMTFLPLVQDETISYSWDFGDNQSSNERVPYHEYALSGTYNVCLTIDNGCVQSYCDSVFVAASGTCLRSRDSLVLVKFYYAANIDSSITELDWDLSQPIDQWDGINLRLMIAEWLISK